MSTDKHVGFVIRKWRLNSFHRLHIKSMVKRFILATMFCLALALPARTEVDIGAEAVFGKDIAKTVLGIDINKMYIGFQFETPGDGFFAVLSVGGGVKVTKRDLGSKVLFRAAVGIGHRFGKHRVSVIFDHVSNGKLNEYNPGLNVYGIRYGYQF